LKGIREVLLKVEKEFSGHSENIESKLAASQKEITCLSTELESSRREMTSKVSEVNNLQALMEESHCSIELLRLEVGRLEEMSTKYVYLLAEMEATKELLSNTRLALDEKNAEVEKKSELLFISEETVRANELALAELNLFVSDLKGKTENLQSALVSCERLCSAHEVRQLAGTSRISTLESEIQDLSDALMSSNAEVSRLAVLYGERERLLSAEDSSLASAPEKIESLESDVKRLQMELVKSERVTAHYETSLALAQNEIMELQAECRSISESLAIVNLDLINSNSNLNELHNKYELTSNRYNLLRVVETPSPAYMSASDTNRILCFSSGRFWVLLWFAIITVTISIFFLVLVNSNNHNTLTVVH